MLHAWIARTPPRPQRLSQLISRQGMPTFCVRYSSLNGIKKRFAVHQFIVIRSGQEYSGRLAVLGNYKRMPGCLKDFEPLGNIGFKFRNRNYVITDRNGFHRVASFL
jgi:hypothetical protein